MPVIQIIEKNRDYFISTHVSDVNCDFPPLLSEVQIYPHFIKTKLSFTLIPDSVSDRLNKG
jgi:hypothetical protein